jgi:thioredoxin-like negative regulator of GroEL
VDTHIIDMGVPNVQDDIPVHLPSLPLSAQHQAMAFQIWESFSQAQTLEEADAVCEAFKSAPDEVRKAIFLAHSNLQAQRGIFLLGTNPFA